MHIKKPCHSKQFFFSFLMNSAKILRMWKGVFRFLYTLRLVKIIFFFSCIILLQGCEAMCVGGDRIETPNYPALYDPGLYCTFQLTASIPTAFIELSIDAIFFNSPFDMLKVSGKLLKFLKYKFFFLSGFFVLFFLVLLCKVYTVPGRGIFTFAVGP